MTKSSVTATPMRRPGTLLAALVLGVGVLAWAGPAQAVESADPVLLYNNATDKCLGISNASKVNGAAAIQWDCAFFSFTSDQNWNLDDLGGGHWQFRNEATKKCLGISNGSKVNGAAAIQWDCSYTRFSDQDWYLRSLGDGSVELQNWKTNKCLGIGNASRVNGAGAIQWDCAHRPGSDQAWTKI